MHLARRAQKPGVIPTRDDASALPAHDPIHRERKPRADRHHPAPERFVIARFDDQVRVVALQRVLDEPKRRTLRAGGECALDGTDDRLRPKRHEIRHQSQRHMSGQDRRETVP
jgi:hypothetical protein